MAENQVLIDGNMTSDPVVNATNSGKTVMKFSIAHNTRKKEGDQWVDGEPSFFDVEFWPSDPQYWAKRLAKGVALRIIGELKQSRWEQDGQQRSKVYVIAKTISSPWMQEIATPAQPAQTPGYQRPAFQQPVAQPTTRQWPEAPTDIF